MHEPAYPIFFPTYTAVATGYTRDWWWSDPDTSAEDAGPFLSRADAVSDWAMEHFSSCLLEEIFALDKALGSPLLSAPQPSHNPCQAMPGLRRSIQEQQSLLEDSFKLVAELKNAQELEAIYLLEEVIA